MVIPALTRRDFNKGNFGDSYICIGLQYLWESATDRPCQWLLLDKFDGGKSMITFEESIREAGFLVIAGTPQYNNLDDWSFWYDEPVWNDYVVKWGLKAFALAGGSGHSDPNMTPEGFARYCAASDRTRRALAIRDRHSVLTTVRDPHAHELLNQFKIQNTHLPCTATWSTHKRGIYKQSNEYVLLVAPSAHHLGYEATGATNEEERLQAPISLMPRMYRVFERMGKKPIVVCHGVKEYDMLRGLVPVDSLWYSNDSHSTLQLYAQAELVISCRLHGALPAYGLGDTKVHMIGIDTRGSAAWSFPEIGYSKFNDVLKLYGSPFEAFCEEALDLKPGCTVDLLKEETKYVSLLRQHMSD